MQALTTIIDSQFKDIKGEMKEMRDRCNICRGPHPSSECDDKLMGGPKEEKAKYAYGGYRGDQCSTRPTGTLLSSTQTNLKPNPTNDKPYRPPPARNEHVNAVFTRSGKTYDPPVHPNAKTTIIHDDSEDEADEAEKGVEPSSSKPTKTNPPSLKAYKQKIPYPQRLRKEKMEECYGKFIDLI
uniref:Reverse transcriptase domain-containing protein n=1 Tax=Tanacetum cinerariifolium TaxID=118510 RepID=A0A6L2JJS8_TANCI|nr:reverse transcriptase domain-containing protein [Tanacetum cinerariifolium]